MEPRYYGAAANYNKPGGTLFNPKLLMIGGLALVIIIVIFVAIAVISGINAGPSRDLATLVAQQTDLQTLTEKSKDRIKSGDLRKVNADASLLLLSDTITLTGYLNSLYSITAIPPEVLAAATDPDTEGDLKTAEQTDKFDIVYIAVINQKLNSIREQVQKVQTQVGNKDLKTTLDATLATITSLQGQLSELPS